MFFKLRLKTLEQGERVGGTAGETRQNPVVKQPPHFAGRRLQHDVAERDLTIAAECDLLAPADRQNSSSVHTL
jgi:hypothetical protein